MTVAVVGEELRSLSADDSLEADGPNVDLEIEPDPGFRPGRGGRRFDATEPPRQPLERRAAAG